LRSALMAVLSRVSLAALPCRIMRMGATPFDPSVQVGLGWNLLLAAPLYFIIRQGQPRRPSCRQTGVGARSDLPNDWTYPSTIRVFALWKHSGGGALLPWNGQDIVAAQTSPLEVAFIAVQQA
jgi:hypothetical protein